MPFRRRIHVYLPALMVGCAIAIGIFAGSRVSAANASDSQVNQNLKTFARIYNVVEQNFADAVKPDKTIYRGAIPAMLRTLDPHSSFFDPKDYASMQEDQRGRYAGTGMIVQQHGGKTVVVAPFAGSPAYKVGLRVGDIILKVDDKETDRLGVTEIAGLLRGVRGAHVQVTITREGSSQPLVFDIVREEITRASVSDAFWLRSGIAYVAVKNFTDENTSKELEDRLRKLGEKDIKGLVLDLRENPGGLLNEGIEVAGHFLKKHELVVSHRGRGKPTKNFTARGDNGGKDYPMVVLVNRRSASAAEIVSGALQDHDRAWILGETTFGKGLVQTVFPLSYNTGLALTTMHFYTPSGRLIQRDYSNVSFLDYYYNNHRDEKNLSDVKMTDSGRTVYGGGGITPDEKSAPLKPNRFQTEVAVRGYAPFNFSVQYYASRPDAKLPNGWEPDEHVLDEFHQFLLKTGVQFSEAEFTENHQWLKDQLKREMYVTAFGYDESERVRIEQDPEVLKAVDSMPRAKALLEGSKKLLVRRLAQQGQAQ